MLNNTPAPSPSPTATPRLRFTLSPSLPMSSPVAYPPSTMLVSRRLEISRIQRWQQGMQSPSCRARRRLFSFRCFRCLEVVPISARAVHGLRLEGVEEPARSEADEVPPDSRWRISTHLVRLATDHTWDSSVRRSVAGDADGVRESCLADVDQSRERLEIAAVAGVERDLMG